MMRLLKNQSGTSLIETLIGIGLMAIISAAIVTVNVMMQRDFVTLQEKFAYSDLSRLVTLALANPTSCFAIFDPTNLVDTSKLPFDATALSAGTPYAFAVKSIPDFGGSSTPVAKSE